MSTHIQYIYYGAGNITHTCGMLKLLTCLIKMFVPMLFITGICTAVAFNIFTTPDRNFRNEDPLLGQTIIQSSEGIFLSSTSGEVFRCTEKSCSRMNLTGTTKVLGPITCVASSWREDKLQLLVHNQVWTMNSSTENSNRNCTHVSMQLEKSKIYSDKLVLQILDHKGGSSNNNNNNKYQGSQIPFHQDHWRKRRALWNDAVSDENEGMEITFVLDGFGHTNKEDFERAKDFIYNLMNNVWTTCFSCNFAIVQQGRDIRTELSLKENTDHLRALDKVKSLKQVQGLTNTTSALYHVITDVFVPQHGSKEKAKKIIILLSDGQIGEDTRRITDDINMLQMEGIVYYATGTGPKVLKEIAEIAGSENRFFKISNYTNLENILSYLEKSIIGIKDAGTEIAFVLDGSSSISPWDFIMATGFIYDVIKKVWTKNFSYKFAVVQFGTDIRTELSLKENNDRLRALDKVKNIPQIYGDTMTTSALYHVLTDVFVPQKGSRDNGKKIIILLSDGQIGKDSKNLRDVLNMPQMEGIVRYAVGLGTDIAVEEMTEIAGSKDRFFKVSNFAELKNMMQPLEKNIIGIEGAGTEVAFVLDGSSNIMEKDFERAKDFIYNVMKNVWTTCVNCKFAVVQFGTDTRTELSLKENNNFLRALDKVKNIKHIYGDTRTTSALYHVLTDVFVPQYGLRENKKKIIILLSDGQMSGDTRNLSDVLNMPQMEGITRYAIGVGLDVLKNPQAVQEMTEVAGSEDRFFLISNYDNFYSSLEKSIIGVEDAGTEIAFLLDGSDNIGKENFVRAKDFIYNMMNDVWTVCLRCKIAVVQYGRVIRKELCLKENNDLLRALYKVKHVKQIFGITKTTSVINHILTDVFVPQCGSRKNSKKIIILLSDVLVAPRNLKEVLRVLQMQGIVRYAIRVGPKVLNEQQATKEMTEIAGSKDRFFQISNYTDLENTVSSLENIINGMEEMELQTFCLP
ncbi:collagen alpha-6(VI) chain-like isoform X2 [Hemibagrus wyckioides]|uniref:collagen alpha-6(VI) chain-like isoform X2 n=1 Tax=Hemibagrus wyckioides TaxID=337641 RepID=UPI00266D9ED3|nr:collagen alpha-6(VI) chain-like isoform X2 [Hemibagrus wyckioides]